MIPQTAKLLLGTSALLSAGLLATPAGAGDWPFEWAALGSGVGNFDELPECMGTYDDGTNSRLIVGGFFNTAGGVAANNIASWDGEQWSAMGSGVDSTPRSMLTWDDGTGPALYVGGQFTTAGGASVSGIAKWDGFEWSSVGGGLNGAAWALEVFDDGSGPALYAGGGFTTAGGQPASFIAKWDGQQWSALGSGVSGVNGVHTLEVFDDGSGPALYAAGGITVAGGQPVGLIAKWDGAQWSPLDTGLTRGGAPALVESLAVFDDGEGEQLYAAGWFTTAGGGPVTNVAKWNGSSWSAAGNLNPGAYVYNMVAFDDRTGPPRLIVLSEFAPGQVAVLQDDAFVELDGSVGGIGTKLHAHDDGTGPALYASGWITSTSGAPGFQPVNNIARWYRPCLAPLVIQQQPQTMILPSAGGGAQFFVGATGFDPSYQWTRDGIDIENDGTFSGADTNQLTINPVSPDLTGYYRCTVTSGVGTIVRSTEVGLAIRPSCPGDANSDGEVNLADLNIILSQFGHVCP